MADPVSRAEPQRAWAAESKQRAWAAPGSGHDRSVRLVRWALPGLALAVLIGLSVAPFRPRDELSFIFDKTNVPRAAEKLSVERATYRGADDKGQPFTLVATRAGQVAGATETDSPLGAGIGIDGLEGSLELKDGPVAIRADRAVYRAGERQVAVPGPVRVEAPNRFTLDTADVDIDLARRTLKSRAPVSGTTRLGSYQAGRVEADLGQRSVRLAGGVRLKIRQGAVKER